MTGPDAVAPDGSGIYFRAVDATHASLVEVVLAPRKVSRPVRHRTVEEIWYFPPDGATAETRLVAPGDVVLIRTAVARR